MGCPHTRVRSFVGCRERMLNTRTRTSDVFPTPDPLPGPLYLGKDLSAAEMVVLIRENL